MNPNLYVRWRGQTFGPLDDAGLNIWIANGNAHGALVQRAGGDGWVRVESTQFWPRRGGWLVAVGGVVLSGVVGAIMQPTGMQAIAMTSSACWIVAALAYVAFRPRRIRI